MSTTHGSLGGSRAPLAITGLGLVSAAGFGFDSLERSLHDGRSHVARLQGIEVSDLPIGNGAEVRSTTTGAREPRLQHFVQRALEGAIIDADSSGIPLPRERTGITLGTTLGLVDELSRDPAAASIAEARERLDVDTSIDELARRTGLGGPTSVFSLACASGLCATEQAAADIALGRADAMLVGGADTLGRFMQGGFCSLHGFHWGPGGNERRRLALGEGAAFVVLEPLEAARSRKRPCLAVLKGQRLVSDGYHIASPNPSGEGMARAIALVLEDVSLTPSDIGAIVVTAVNSPFHERMLKAALRRALASSVGDVPLTTHELAIGHVLAASSIVAIALAARVLDAGHVIPAFSVAALDAPGTLEPTSPRSMRLQTRNVLALSVGFGGFNGVAIVGSEE